MRKCNIETNFLDQSHFHINLYGMLRFSGYHFSAYVPDHELSIKIDQKFVNRL